MPSEYAHYRFGQDVLKKLPQQERVVAMQGQELYELGLHGPDILFFYHPATRNAVNDIAHALHRASGMPFFSAACAKTQETVGRSQTEFAEDLSYLYGFVCHFVLDSLCHPFVYDEMAASGHTHTAIEVAFDRSLMVADGIDPLHHVRTAHLNNSYEDGEVMSRFFPAVSPVQAVKAITTFKVAGRGLTAPGIGKRAIVYGVLIASGHYPDQKGQVVTWEHDPAFDESNSQLKALYDEGVPKAVELIVDFRAAVSEGRPLDPWFERTFGAKDI